MINILVVEDEEIQRKNFIKMIKEIDKNISAYEAEDEEAALQIAKDCNIDFFYFDISLKASSGLDLALKIRKIHKYELSWIIFITTYEQHALYAFKKIHCYDYILKPYNKEDVKNMTKCIISHIGSKNNSYGEKSEKYVLFEKNKIKIKVFLKDIYFIEVVLRNTIVHTVQGKYELDRMSLKNVLSLVKNDFIIQSHRSYIINTKYIRQIEKIAPTSWRVSFYNYHEPAFIGAQYKDNVDEILRSRQV
ncbi:LytR/AlgR family response regulator transcription factor [Clostridium hydrogenum]|uniref:LytR/AlgR family response regulator transcription factor n=1 Tax=Clostridium hydrogenum TaxID=2855764 RepID=UPI001F1F7D89|nr:LytTR family DNA-binding domain-containing protein [Clostridium hydrogenum]